MAPPPEYDKEPKAPDKSATTITNEDSKIMNSLNDHQINSDQKITTTANSEAEKKVEDSVENLDDGRLRALLDEAITYKCPKDREGKSDLFKNLLEEAEQDDQATEAAARGGGGGGGGRARRAAGRRALAHSNSLQDLVAAALAAEPAPRRPRPHAPVSARATHGGSLPSGVDTSFLLGEEPTRAGYLATVRCVNPPPLAERRVSASDANCPAEVELLHRRSKPVFPMTYTARATLEIGSGSVSSGRAVTTTTASNQVRTPRSRLSPHRPPDANQSKLMNALRRTKRDCDSPSAGKEGDPRGPQRPKDEYGISWGDITAMYSPENRTAAADCPENNVQAKCSTETTTSRCSPENATSLCLPKNKTAATKRTQNKVNGKCSAETATARSSPENTMLRCPPKNKTAAANHPQHKVTRKCSAETATSRSSLENATLRCPPKNKTAATNCRQNKVTGKCSAETATSRCLPENATSPRLPKNNTAATNCPQNKVNGKCSAETPTSRSLPENATSRCPPKTKTDTTNCPKNIITVAHSSETATAQFVPNKLMSRCPPINKTIAKKFPKNKGTARNSPENATPAGPPQNTTARYFSKNKTPTSYSHESEKSVSARNGPDSDLWIKSVDRWYESLTVYKPPFQQAQDRYLPQQMSSFQQINKQNVNNNLPPTNETLNSYRNENMRKAKINPNIDTKIYTADENAHGLPPSVSSCKKNPVATSISSNCDTLNVNTSVEYDNNKYFKQFDVISDKEESEIKLRKEYRKRVGYNLVVPNLSSFNPRNIRPMTIGNIPAPLNESPVSVPRNKKNFKHLDIKSVKKNSIEQSFMKKTEDCDTSKAKSASNANNNTSIKYKDNFKIVKINDILERNEGNNNPTTKGVKLAGDIFNNSPDLRITNNPIINKIQQTPQTDKVQDIELEKVSKCDKSHNINSSLQFYEDQQKLFQVLKEADNTREETELVEIVSDTKQRDNKHSFVKYYTGQQNLLQALKETNEDGTNEEQKGFINSITYAKARESCSDQDNNNNETEGQKTKQQEPTSSAISLRHSKAEDIISNDIIVKLNEKPQEEVPSDPLVLAKLPNNPYVFLTMPQRLFTPLSLQNINKKRVQIQEIQNDADNIEIHGNNEAPKRTKKKKDKPFGITDAKKKENINKTTLKVLLFDKLKRDYVNASSEDTKKGDSAIPFSCITTPEVVSSCNTTSTIAQSAVAVDPKPLQLGSGYCAVASLTGAPPAARRPDTAAAFAPLQPRSVISSSFNGLSLTRPNYGSTATAVSDEYKKSLDENGNAVQGFSSPISGSSQHKKPRRKKSSKNETVITSHQIDGYQGNKDLNEVLRFIESNAEHGRGAKLPRAKHKDDDDKGKKRSSERRKDKDKLKRASSLEERSRTKLEDLTDAPHAHRVHHPHHPHHPHAPQDAKPERRSWGADARDAFYYPEPEPAAELTDFQTVTKRRKPRRRADDSEREPPRRPRPPSPRTRRESAPPSERSNDSNDDQDSVHSLPPPPPPAHHASYADIARTRHNIPDLIESCNFYAEGEPPPPRPPAAPDAPDAPDAADAADAPDADGYPALGNARLARKPPPRRKERAPPAPATDSPAPDVLGDRRPAVILLDEATRPRDLDGVTFGFDINEQLLVAGARRPRCDLVRDAIDSPVGVGVGVGGGVGAAAGGGVGAAAGVAVVTGCAALRYVPPEPPPDTHHLHQIIDYVGNAWEDVVRCGNGKVRYFSE